MKKKLLYTILKLCTHVTFNLSMLKKFNAQFVGNNNLYVFRGNFNLSNNRKDDTLKLIFRTID